MKATPRFLLSVTLAGSLLLGGMGNFVIAQDAAAPAAAPAPAPAPEAAPAAAPAGGAAGAAATAPVDEALRKDVEDFWHYAKIARYDLANAQANKILERRDRSGEVLKTFEAVAAARKDNLDQWMLRWQQVDPIKDSTTKLMQLLNEGRGGRRSDLTYIEENIKRLAGGERAYALAIGRLRESGELAVPIMVDYLRDPAKREYHVNIRQALKDMGRTALNPLVAATEMKEPDALIMIVDALGEIGYDVSVPYLVRVTRRTDVPDAVRTASVQALLRMGIADATSINAADSFYDVGEKFYYDTAAIAADPRFPAAFVWYWDDVKGLTSRDVPTPIFNEIMAMRSAEYALKLDASKSSALSLWLASNYKREAELPQGAKDPTRAEGQPDAHYYGVASGAQYVNQVLARAVHDRNAAVALASIRSLQNIAGESNLFTGTQQGQPIIDALSYPDRLVRFESAFALAEALPQKPFVGQDRVVPILSEAIAQTGRPNILFVLPSQDMINSVSDSLKADYGVAGATTAAQALQEANRLPSVDVVVMTEELPQSEIDQMFVFSSQIPRLEGAAKLIITKTGASRFAASTINNPMITVSQANDAAALKAAIASARQRAGAMGMDEKMANDYAMRAADLLAKLAISRGQVFDLSVAEPQLLIALDDARPDLVKASGNVLGLIHSKSAQLGLLSKASDEKTADDVKISLYKSLATNAKFFGNALDVDAINTLSKTVESAPNLQVRSAAAEARGALNLPADQAKTLIINQSKV